MRDNSMFVLQWEIDNATATLATGKAKSGVFNEGGFKWTAELNRRVAPDGDLTYFVLRCDVDHNGPWKCEIEASVHLLHLDTTYYEHCEQRRFCFDKASFKEELLCSRLWDELKTYNTIHDKVTVEFRIRIIIADRGSRVVQPTVFDAPNRMSNVVLKIGEKKLHVSREYLSVHSPVFETIFFGEFSGNGTKELVIKDVVYEEFLDLLRYIYHDASKITDHSVLHILKLSHEFELERVLDHCQLHLTQSEGFDVVKKLQIADEYRLVTLRDNCLNSFTTINELLDKVKLSSEYEKFSDEMKLAINDHIMNF